MKNKKSEILVIGSVVNDVTIFPNGKEKKSLGGTGNNIAFGLGVLKLYPILLSVVGDDFDEKFIKFLEKNGVVLEFIKNKGGKTAVFSIEINHDGKEVGKWRPNSANDIEKVKLQNIFKKEIIKNIKIAIFSPGTPKSTRNHLIEFSKDRASDSIAIFDPGQMTDFYSKKEMEDCINYSDVLILNKLEFSQAERILKKSLTVFAKNKIIIKTKGEEGSEIYENGKTIHLKSIKPKKIRSTVGAGDAYRVGLISGLLSGKNIKNSCKLGTKFASRSLEKVGCHKSFFKI